MKRAEIIDGPITLGDLGSRSLFVVHVLEDGLSVEEYDVAAHTATEAKRLVFEAVRRDLVPGDYRLKAVCHLR